MSWNKRRDGKSSSTVRRKYVLTDRMKQQGIQFIVPDGNQDSQGDTAGPGLWLFQRKNCVGDPPS
jgi:hypothetical protein